jgi:hypothetical protein
MFSREARGVLGLRNDVARRWAGGWLDRGAGSSVAMWVGRVSFMGSYVATSRHVRARTAPVHNGAQATGAMWVTVGICPVVQRGPTAVAPVLWIGTDSSGPFLGTGGGSRPAAGAPPEQARVLALCERFGPGAARFQLPAMWACCRLMGTKAKCCVGPRGTRGTATEQCEQQ